MLAIVAVSNTSNWLFLNINVGQHKFCRFKIYYIRRFLGKNGEVDLYLTSKDLYLMANALESFKECFVNLTISNDDLPTLTAKLYTEKSSSAKEGNGKLFALMEAF